MNSRSLLVLGGGLGLVSTVQGGLGSLFVQTLAGLGTYAATDCVLDDVPDGVAKEARTELQIRRNAAAGLLGAAAFVNPVFGVPAAFGLVFMAKYKKIKKMAEIMNPAPKDTGPQEPEVVAV